MLSYSDLHLRLFKAVKGAIECTGRLIIAIHLLFSLFFNTLCVSTECPKDLQVVSSVEIAESLSSLILHLSIF